MFKQQSIVRLLLAVGTSGLGTMFLANASIASPQDFIVENKTQADLVELYIAASPALDWEHNLLAQQSLRSGNKNIVKFYGDLSQCVYDIRSVFGDGEEVKSERVDLCKTTTYTLSDR
jgi:hypothetical protein